MSVTEERMPAFGDVRKTDRHLKDFVAALRGLKFFYERGYNVALIDAMECCKKYRIMDSEDDAFPDTYWFPKWLIEAIQHELFQVSKDGLSVGDGRHANTATKFRDKQLRLERFLAVIDAREMLDQNGKTMKGKRAFKKALEIYNQRTGDSISEARIKRVYEEMKKEFADPKKSIDYYPMPEFIKKEIYLLKNGSKT